MFILTLFHAPATKVVELSITIFTAATVSSTVEITATMAVTDTTGTRL